MIKVSKIKDGILYLFLLFFCLPLAFANFESTFILVQFAALIPAYLILSAFSTSIYGLGLIMLFGMLSVLVIFGLPGSFVGWISMVCAGYLVGQKASREREKFLYAIKPFILVVVFFSFWICFKNYQNPFSQELLSDYFEASSINTAPILIVCSANLYCATYYYILYHQGKGATMVGVKLEGWLPLALCAAAITSAVMFGFRSGFGIIGLSILVFWASVGTKDRMAKYSLIILILVLILVLAGDDIYALMVNLIVPGRSDMSSVMLELSEGALRYERLVAFWKIAAFSKTNLDVWSSQLSVSGMSDLSAGLFPGSLIFFVPALSLLKILKTGDSGHQVHGMIILMAAFSSLLISILQPDFYSMFTFFAITSLIHHGEKRKKIRKKELLRTKISGV